MLKAGEFSPNNPLLRGERSAAGDALLGLGEYERRRNTLRRIRQQQYREYLDQQAKKKQEAKEQAEKERREREEKEREREEREREIVLERDKYSPERRRLSLNYVPAQASVSYNKVDTGVQVDGVTRPLSVAIQTDDAELFRLPPSPSKYELTQAERELSPRTVGPPPPRVVEPPPPPPRAVWPRPECESRSSARRRSYGDFDERTSPLNKKTNRDKLVSELRHTYMPSIFDADAIQLRNLQTEKEAATRRQFYQQELKNQILEQQRIREERKSREKMLEQAEMRRLEEQLRMLRLAQEREFIKHHDITASIKEHAKDYETKRTELQYDIDLEQQKLLRATSQPTRTVKRNTVTSKSDSQTTKLPFRCTKIQERSKNEQPFSFNIPDNSIFSSNYDVDSYLRRNLNFQNISMKEKDNNNIDKTKNVIEKALIHDRPYDKPKNKTETKEPSSKVETNIVQDLDSLSIPVLRHSPKPQAGSNESVSNLSEAMKTVDDKWKVPAIQQNILKTLPNEEGRNINILTQLGSIRRQLQLEQLKLDKMLSKDDNV